MADHFFLVATQQIDRFPSMDLAEAHTVHCMLSEQLAFLTWNLLMSKTYGYDSAITSDERAMNRWLELARRWNRLSAETVDLTDALHAVETEIDPGSAMKNRRWSLATVADLH